MSRVAPLSRIFLHRLALLASLVALAMLSLPHLADAGERRTKGAHSKRHHVSARHNSAQRFKNVSGGRSDVYRFKKQRHARNGNPAYRSGTYLASGWRTEGVYGYRGAGRYGYRNGWAGSGVYNVRDRYRYETAREKVKWLRAYDRPYDGFQNGSGYRRNFGFEYGAPLILEAGSGWGRESTRDRVKALRSFDRPYDGYYNGRGYGGYSSGAPLVIQVGPGAGAPEAPPPDGASLEGGCAKDQYCTVRLGPYSNSPKIITLNTTGSPLGGSAPAETAPGEEPEVYEAPEGEPVN